MAIKSPTMFFGTQEGMFHISTDWQWGSCGSFDPQVYPWYIAASSGPKNVILVLDASGSMLGQSLELLMKAAICIVNTLIIGD